MSEATGEQTILQNLTKEEREQVEKNVADLQRRGTPVTRGVVTELIRALRQQKPVEREGRSESEERNNDAATGKSTVDFLPPELKEEPVIKMQRQLTEIGKNIEELQKNTAKLKDYNPPPGEKIDVGDIKWSEYGWEASEKAQVKGALATMFRLDSECAERAAESLLLAGYDAKEVIEKLAAEKDEINKQIPNYGFSGAFRNAFTDDNHKIYDSSLRIVFNEEFRRSHEFDQIPRDMEELAWQMSWAGNAGRLGGRWMFGRENSLFDIRGEELKDDKGQKRFRGKYYVNEANFREWFLDQTNLLYDIHGPDGQINAFDDIKIDKGPFSRVTFREMIEKQNQLFVSEDQKTQYMQMWLQLQYDESNFITLYTNDVIYRQASKQGLDKWMEEYEKMSFQNYLTKLGFRSNMLQRLLTGAELFEEGRKGEHGDTYLSDNRLGTAFLEMSLAFYNLGDLEKLEQILGKDSSFFTREGWDETIEAIAKAIRLRPRGAVRLDKDAEEALDKAFAKGSNTITDRKEFQKFINLVGTKHLFGAYQELFMRTAVQLAVQKRYGIKSGSSGIELYASQAWFFNRIMGGMARNDVQMSKHKRKDGSEFWTPNPSVHDKMSELLNLDANRRKYAAEGGGKPFGNLYTLGQFKAAIVDPMNGLVTQDGVSILKTLEDLHRIRVEQQRRIDAMWARGKIAGLSHEQIEKDVEQEQIKHNREYMNKIARDVQFREDAQIEYVQVHVKPGKDWAHRVVNGEGLDFNAFTNFDPWGAGSTVKRDVFIKEIQKKMIGTIRDMVKKYNYMDFNDDVRISFYDPKTGEHGFRNGKLGEQEFGYDLLNRKEFWKTDERGSYIMENGRHVIDYKKVNKERGILMKQIFLMELQADMYNHQALNSGDVRFPPTYYLNVIDALKKMPGEVLIDEFSAHGLAVPEGFWTKEDFKWLEKRALSGGILGSGKFPFLLKWFFASMVDKRDKDGLGFGKSLSIIGKAIFSGLT